MREIKFRAFDTEMQKYTEGQFILSSVKKREITLVGVSIDGDADDSNEEIIFEQFTGLKDKNGKEIYEGDILREPPKDDWEKKNYACFEVFFHDGDANSDYNIGYTMNRMHCHGSVCGGVVLSFKPKTVSKMIVIGNIHQNPELL